MVPGLGLVISGRDLRFWTWKVFSFLTFRDLCPETRNLSLSDSPDGSVLSQEFLDLWIKLVGLKKNIGCIISLTELEHWVSVRCVADESWMQRELQVFL